MVKNLMVNKKIIICGSLCDTDIAVAELLSRHSIPVYIIRLEGDELRNPNSYKNKLKYFNLNKIVYINSQPYIKKILKEAKLIISLTGSIDKFLRLRDYFFRVNEVLPKTINITTGADITEIAREKSLKGIMFRSLLNRSLCNYLNPYPEVINTIKYIKLKKYNIIKSPYYLVDDYVESDMLYKTSSDKVKYLHASNLDWGSKDNNKNRNTTKGNDKFIRAFIRAVNEGKKITCSLLLRGPDKEKALEMINNSGAGNAFEYINPVSQGELYSLIVNSDIVVDQFDVGALGGIACEAMAQKKPVITYVDINCSNIVFNKIPPILNCHTEDEIYKTIMKCNDHIKLKELGVEAEEWIREFIDIHTADFSEFILKVCMAAGLKWPRKDFSNDTR